MVPLNTTTQDRVDQQVGVTLGRNRTIKFRMGKIVKYKVMKRFKLLLPLLAVLCGLNAQSATVVMKYSDFPNTDTLSPGDLFLIAIPGVTNKNITAAQFRGWLSQFFPASQITQTFPVSNFYLYSTNLFFTNVTVQDFFTTNVYQNTYMSNFFLTNLITTNVFAPVTITNVTVQDTFVSNYFNTNIYNNSYVSNYFTTNSYDFTTNFYTTNVFYTTNYFYTITNVEFITVSNAYITNLTVKNLSVTNITAFEGIHFVPVPWSGPTNPLPLFSPRQYYATFTPISITGYTGKSNTVTESVLLTITNASTTNILATIAAGTMTGNYTNQYTISNASSGKFWFEYDPIVGDTNSVFRQMK